MNKQREALRIALDALEEYQEKGAPFFKCDSAVKAIREALSEPEKTNQCGETCERAKLCAVCAGGVSNNEPLTDEQVEDEWERITGHSIFGGDRKEGRAMYLSPDEVIEFARAIERAHGIGV